MAEEIRGLTWDLNGEQLDPWQAAQRLYLAGFKDAQLLCKFWAVLEAESGGYLRAWHHNVERLPDGTILRDSQGRMTVKSTDLGFIQKNIVHDEPVKILDEAESQAFVDSLFDQHPELANGAQSAEIAYNMFKQRGFQPWYAYSNGSYKKSLERACLAVGNYLGMVFTGNKNLLQRRIN